MFFLVQSREYQLGNGHGKDGAGKRQVLFSGSCPAVGQKQHFRQIVGHLVGSALRTLNRSLDPPFARVRVHLFFGAANRLRVKCKRAQALSFDDGAHRTIPSPRRKKNLEFEDSQLRRVGLAVTDREVVWPIHSGSWFLFYSQTRLSHLVGLGVPMSTQVFFCCRWVQVFLRALWMP